MFQFLKSRPKDQPDPLATAKNAADWFRRLPAADVIGRQQHVVSAFAELLRVGKPIDHDHIAAIEWLDAALAAERGRLIRQYTDSTSRSGAVGDRIWQAAYELCNAFIRVYRRIVDTALASSKDPHWKRTLPRVIARLVHFYGTDAKLRVLHSEQWIPAKWSELHRLYLKAAELGIERTPITSATEEAEDAPTTVEQEYTAVLLTHLLNIGTLTPPEIDWAGAKLRSWCSGLALEQSPRAGGGFCVDLTAKMGFYRCTETDRGKSMRYLDTARLVDRLNHGIAALQPQKSEEADASGLTAQQRTAVLQKVRAALSDGDHITHDRQPRIRMSLPADVRIGLAQISAQLATKGDAEDAFESTIVPTEEDPLAGAAKEAPVVAGRKDRSRITPQPTTGARWKLEDRSVTGLRLSVSGGNTQPIPLGTLIAVREAQTGSSWGLGVVRRVNRTESGLDVGVALLATDFVRVGLHAKRHAREDMGFVVDGIDVSTIGTRFSGVYLPPPSRPENPVSLKTLIIPTSEYAHGRNVVLITARSVYTVALHKAYEQRPEWTWAAIEIVSKTARG